MVYGTAGWQVTNLRVGSIFGSNEERNILVRPRNRRLLQPVIDELGEILVAAFVGGALHRNVIANLRVHTSLMSLCVVRGTHLRMVLDDSRVILVPVASVPYQSVVPHLTDSQQHPVLGLVLVVAT